MKTGYRLATGIISIGLTFASVAASFADCDYMENHYPEHSLTCQSGQRFKCEDGTWTDMDEKCQDGQTARSFENYECTCTNSDVNNCLSQEKKCSATQEIGGCVKKCVD